MLYDTAAELTDAARAAMERGHPRLRQLMTSLVEHLHAFVRDVKLSECELEQALDFLTAIGKATTPTHNETVLAADVLGVSSLVKLINHGCEAGETEPALLGPFYRANAPAYRPGASIALAEENTDPLCVFGAVKDVSGAAIADAIVDVWQASPVGLYENQDPAQPEMNLRGRFQTDPLGRFAFNTVRPAGYPVPVDGPIGTLLQAQQRTPMRPAHIHFLICSPAHETLVTQVFVDDESACAADVVFGARRSLIRRVHTHREPHPLLAEAVPPFAALECNFCLRPGASVLPAAPIA